jgi:carbonic anhydrase
VPDTETGDHTSFDGSVIDVIVAANRAYAAGFPGPLPTAPAHHLAIVSCMDSRIDLFDSLGLALGEAHIIRNAGGVVTDDVIRSLTISQRKLDTREIALIHHTDCGLLRITDDSFSEELAQEVGMKPTWPIESFTDPVVSVRRSMMRVRTSPFIPSTRSVRGFVFDVATGLLEEVDAAG